MGNTVLVRLPKMLSRIKFQIEPLVNEILDQLPKEVWASETTTFFDPAMAGGQFVREIERRLRSAGHSVENISGRVYGCESSLLSVKYAVNKYKLVGTYSAGDFLAKDFGNMKFDVIVGNPPYQDKKGNENSTNSADLYTKFVVKSLSLSKNYIAMVVPSAWTGPKNSSLKKIIFEDNQPILLNTHGKKWFDVEMNTCYFISEIGRRGPTVIRDSEGNTITMVLNRTISVSTDISAMSVKAKICLFAEKNNFGSRWIRGKLHLNEVDKNLGGDIEFIKAVGRRDSALETTTLKSGVESTGYGIDKLVIPNMGSSSGLGLIKVAKQNHVGGHSVVFLMALKKDNLTYMKHYLESNVIRFLINALKISTPNSKTLFTFIPTVDFSRSWTDQELYQHFGLTQEEIDYIENNVK